MSELFAEDFPDRVSAPSWLIGATTYAVDRVVPAVEFIHQPTHVRAGGHLALTTQDHDTALPVMPAASRMGRLKQRLAPAARHDRPGQYLFDTRYDNYFNWSHHINRFLLLALLARELVAAPVLVIVPPDAPRVLLDLYALFGFETLATDAAVRGRVIDYHLPDADIMEAARQPILERVQRQVVPVIAGLRGQDRFRKLFLARRKTRAIVNMADVEPVLADHGFVTIYPEILSAADQLRLWNEASHVVAIHGAGMAPLQFRQPDRPAIRLVEVCPVGHMTRFFRSMCHDVGGRYVAVRGRLKPAYVAGLYRQKQMFLKWSEDSFEVDPHSLSLALALVDGGNDRGHALPDPGVAVLS